MWHWQRTILTAAVQCTLWLRQALRASAHEYSVPAEDAVSAMDGVTFRFVLSRASKALTAMAVWEARSLTAGTLLGLIVVFVVYYLRSPWRKLPPRPRGLPIIGNALQAMDKSWLVSKDCKERFGGYRSSSNHWHGNAELDAPRQSPGEVMYLDVAGQPTVVLNSLKSTYELLERRATTYSGRPRRIMVQEILSQGLLFSLMGYEDR
jgi:hypothetical protein